MQEIIDPPNDEEDDDGFEDSSEKPEEEYERERDDFDVDAQLDRYYERIEEGQYA